MRPIGVLPSQRPSYIDHLVPLSSLFEAPILVTSAEVQWQIEHFYPQQETVLAETKDFNLDPYLEPYTHFIYVDLFRLATGSFWFADYSCSLPRKSLCALHGNSEKAWKIFRFERFLDEQQVLIYGESWLDHLQRVGVLNRIPKPLIGGNYRLNYFHQHIDFFRKRIKPYIEAFEGKRVLLYAPTWSSENLKTELSRDYSPFLEVLPRLLNAKPDDWHLCIKLHPHYCFLYPEKVQELKLLEKEGVTLLTEMPLIYPLLEQVDAYLGDYSSIGYDFLAFDRPLLFCAPPREDLLHSCGPQLNPLEAGRAFSLLEQKDCYRTQRKKVYQKAFGEKKIDMQTLKEQIIEKFR